MPLTRTVYMCVCVKEKRGDSENTTRGEDDVEFVSLPSASCRDSRNECLSLTLSLFSHLCDATAGKETRKLRDAIRHLEHTMPNRVLHVNSGEKREEET